MKKLVTLLLACFILVSCVLIVPACEPKEPITIPDVSMLDEETCQMLLKEKGLIPKVIYEYDNFTEEGLVVKTSPKIGSQVYKDDAVTIVVSKGKRFFYLSKAVGYIKDIKGIEAFQWAEDEENATKGFYRPYVEEGYLYIEIYLKCKSKSKIEFYNNFGTASTTDTFDKTVLIDVLYDSKIVGNNGEETTFSVKIPLHNLGTQKPSNIYIEFYFTVGEEHQRFEAGFDLLW